MRHSAIFGALLAIVCAFSTGTAWSQAQRGTISVTVTDADGGGSQSESAELGFLLNQEPTIDCTASFVVTVRGLDGEALASHAIELDGDRRFAAVIHDFEPVGALRQRVIFDFSEAEIAYEGEGQCSVVGHVAQFDTETGESRGRVPIEGQGWFAINTRAGP